MANGRSEIPHGMKRIYQRFAGWRSAPQSVDNFEVESAIATDSRVGCGKEG